MITQLNFGNKIPESIFVEKTKETIDTPYLKSVPLSCYDSEENSYQFEIERVSYKMWFEVDEIYLKDEKGMEIKVKFDEIEITREENVAFEVTNWNMYVKFVFPEEERKKSKFEKIALILDMQPISISENARTTGNRVEGNSLRDKCKFKFKNGNCIWGYEVVITQNELQIWNYKPEKTYIPNGPRSQKSIEDYLEDVWEISKAISLKNVYFDEKKCQLYFYSEYKNGVPVQIAIQYNKNEVEAVLRNVAIKEMFDELAALRKVHEAYMAHKAGLAEK